MQMREKIAVRISTVLAILGITFLAGCGNEHCFSVGPFGDCKDTQPPNRNTQTGGQFRIELDQGQDTNLIYGETLQLRPRGGNGPYRCEVDRGEGQVDPNTCLYQSPPNGPNNATVVIRAEDSSQQRQLGFKSLLLRNP
jgi:hypothetical protein